MEQEKEYQLAVTFEMASTSMISSPALNTSTAVINGTNK